MSPADKDEADQENMTLTIESARAIGCRITDSTGDKILRKDPPTIRSFLVDLIRVRFHGNVSMLQNLSRDVSVLLVPKTMSQTPCSYVIAIYII